MKSFLVLSAVLSVSALAVPIGTCVPGAVHKYIGNPCAQGDQVFSNFAYSGNGEASNFNINFQSVRAEFHLLLASAFGAGFLTTPSFTDRTTVPPGVASNVLAATNQLRAANDQSNFSPAQVPAGEPGVVNNPGAAFTLVPDIETEDETDSLPFSADADSATAASSVTEVVSESATFSMIASGLLCFGLLRRRMA